MMRALQPVIMPDVAPAMQSALLGGLKIGQHEREQQATLAAGRLAAENNLVGARDAFFKGGLYNQGNAIRKEMAAKAAAAARAAQSASRRKAEQLRTMMGQGALLADTPEKWQAFLDAQAANGADIGRYSGDAGRMTALAVSGLGDDALKLRAKAAGSGPSYAKNAIYGQDKDGNTVLMQLGSDGSAIATRMPEDVSVSGKAVKIDAGTHWQIMDPVTRQIVHTVPKDISGAAQQKAFGKERGEAKANLGATTVKAEQALSTVNKLRRHKGRKMGTGLSGAVPSIPGTSHRDFNVLLKQAQGQTFLQAFESLKGGGHITEIEGQKGQEAIARLDQTQSEEGFLEALSDLEAVIQKGLTNARRKAGVSSPAKASPSGWSIERVQ